MANPNVETVISEFVKLRDKRAAMKRLYEEKDFKLKTAMEKIEGWLLNKLNKEEMESFKTAAGTAYTAIETKMSCADWPGFWQFVQQNGRADMLEKRVSISVIKQFEEETGNLPPYINKTEERVVRVRRT